MADLSGDFPTHRATMKTLAFAIGIWLTLDGTAFAQQTCTAGPPDPWPAHVTEPAPEDRQAIMDVIHTYAWTLDDRNAATLEETLNELFTDPLEYEACSGGGQIQMFKATSLAELVLYLQGQFQDLNNKRFRIRHLEGNVRLRSLDKDTVDGKTTVLVTLQRMDDAAVPEFDYTATRMATFVRTEDEDDSGNRIWKIEKMALVTDTPEVEDRGR